MVDKLTVTFNAPLTLAAGAITLTNQSGGAVPNVSLQWSTTNDMTYVITFSGTAIIGGSLANGRYVLTVNHAYVSPSSGVMAANQSYSFYRLFGDFLGTGTVSASDYLIFKKADGAAVGSQTYSTYWYCDYYFDNLLDIGTTIGVSDLDEFLDYLGTSI
jgi:hypothetical protein